MRQCDYCSKDLNKTLVTEIGCKHIFCIRCSSLVCFSMEICPKCQTVIKNEKIYFYDEAKPQTTPSVSVGDDLFEKIILGQN